MAYQEEKSEELMAMVEAVKSIAGAKGLASDLRTTILSGVLTTVGTVTTVTTVTTVGTVTNLGTLATLSNITGIGGFNATPFIPGQNNQTAVLSNINNVIVS